MKRISGISFPRAVRYSVLLAAGLLVMCCIAAMASADQKDIKGIHAWSGEELRILRSLSLSSLPPLPNDPSNKYADDPLAIELGKILFFDKMFSANGKVSCATCHIPEQSFTDTLPLGKGMGTTTRRTMPLIGNAYNAWFFWDGRKDSLWSQAIGPIESPVEHGFTRSMCAHLIGDKYKREYEGIFGKLPRMDHKSCPPKASPGTGNPAALKTWKAMKPEDRESVNRIYTNIGKAIAAFVRQILPQSAPFDQYVDAVAKNDLKAAEKMMNSNAVDGLRLFIGKAKCTNCHMGPLFTNSSFHHIGVGDAKDRGRAEGIDKVLGDEFNCFGKYSDAKPEECSELRFIDTNKAKYVGAFKTPSLRNVAERPPYMHTGQMKTLSEVLSFYRQSGSRELEHDGLTDDELVRIEAFLKTLSAPLQYPQF
ncbi:MAG: cytochrome-c peroxidase [Nitrospirae bacterium]|nr:cytochrome-c peroxidase [Nitrospirota bacterium]